MNSVRREQIKRRLKEENKKIKIRKWYDQQKNIITQQKKEQRKWVKIKIDEIKKLFEQIVKDEYERKMKELQKKREVLK